MADLNALIAQGVQVKEPPNPFAQYAQMQQLQHGEQQNQMNQMAMQEKQRGFQEMNALRGLMSSPGFDLATPKSQRDVYNVAPTRAEEIIKGHYVNLKTAADIENLKRTGLHSEAQTKDLAIKAIDQTFSNFTKLNSPLEAATSEDGVRRYVTNLYNDPLLGAISAKKMPLDQAIELNVAAAAKDPQAWISAHSGLTGEHIFKTLQDTTKTTDLGGTSSAQRFDAFGRPIGGPVVTAKTPVLSTAAATEQARAATSNALTNVGQLNVARQRLAEEGRGVTYIPDAAGGYTAVPSRLAPGVAPVSRTVLTAEGVPFIGKDASKTGVSEQQAAYNIGRLLTAANQIKDITGKDPSAIQPGAAEALASSVGMSGTANLARPANRQIVQGAQRDALDALLYLSTGAAYNKEQLLGQMDAYIPSYTDEPENVAAKQTRMADLIQSAKTRAGKAWTPKMDAAMKALMLPSKASGNTPEQNTAGVSVTLPDGRVKTFPSAEAANQFKKAAGIK